MLGGEEDPVVVEEVAVKDDAKHKAPEPIAPPAKIKIGEFVKDKVGSDEVSRVRSRVRTWK